MPCNCALFPLTLILGNCSKRHSTSCTSRAARSQNHGAKVINPASHSYEFKVI